MPTDAERMRAYRLRKKAATDSSEVTQLRLKLLEAEARAARAEAELEALKESIRRLL